MDSRAVREARERAEDSLREYAALLHAWNAPDDDHTRLQLARLLNEVVEETLGG